MVVVTLLVFFTAFNVLEATMPSLVAKISPPDRKGTAMGIFSTAQFLGAFIGGAAGGWVSSHFGLQGVFAFCALGALLWFGVAVTMTPPQARRANPEAEKVIGRGGEVWPEG
jgi:predicted MFS family arabinose efflux permease